MEPFALADLPIRHYAHRVFDSARWDGFVSRSDDIHVCTPYKAGTTWTQMICALLVFQTPELHLPLAEISPWLELKAATADETHAVYAAQRHRRIIKSHTPLDGLRWIEGARYICVQRDPRDVCMSMLNHMQISNPDADALFDHEAAPREGTPPIPEDPDELCRLWLTKGSFRWEEDGFPFWSLFRHAESFWMHRDNPQILMVHYADLKADREGSMRRIADFLGIVVAPERWPALVKAASFESMRQNADRTAPDTNFNMWTDNKRFFNKGTSRQWEGVLSAETLALMATVIRRYPDDMIDWLFAGDPPR